MPVRSTFETLFVRAAEIENAAERDAYLAAACGNDAALRRELDELLAAHRHAGSFMELPAADLAATALQSIVGEKPGATIGPYKLLEQVGEGGMGLVFMAEQSQPLRRRVALKIIKPGLDTRAVIARFEAERQALALMDHPNIARVFDAGATESGRPYFVMELVRGAPITAYCERQHLLIRERLELFLLVCQAVQHAHQKGVIHRDLKPTNILVAQTDTAAVPKVIDFGVAKATSQQLTERTLFTGFQQIIGTPLYMSPEQADLENQDVDTRSDVYSLGVVLYELLTGATPFDASRLKSAGQEEMRRIIREEEPPKPSTRATTAAAALSTMASAPSPKRAVVVSALKGDLDWIVMKALEKDRRRRYESPSALAADIGRHLASEPVEAYPPTARYRVWKFVRRNRVTLATISAISAALVVGIAVSIWQAVRARQAERTAQAALGQARTAVDDMYTGVAEKWLESQGALTTVQRELLEKALGFYIGLATQPGAAADVQDEAVSALLRVGVIQRRLGNHVEAEQTLQRAISQCERLISENPDRPPNYLALVEARTQLAAVFATTGRMDAMIEQSSRAALHMAKLKEFKLSGTEDRVRIAKAFSSLSSMLSQSNRRDEARDAIAFALDSWKSLLAESPENFDYRYGFALAKTRQGTAQMWWRSDDEAAEANLREADVLLTALLKERPTDVECRRTLGATALTNLGNLVGWRNRPREAIEPHRRSLALGEGLANEFPDYEADQTAYLTSMTNLASTLREAGEGKSGEIAQLVTKAHVVARELVHRFPASVNHKRAFVETYIEVSRGLHVRGKHRETLEFCRGALTDLQTILKAPGNGYNEGLANECLSMLAALHLDFGDHAAAAEALRSYTQKRFNDDYANRYRLEGGELKSRRIDDFETQAFVLLKPALLYDGCIRLAQQDASLSAEQRSAACDSYRAQANWYRDEGLRAIEAWMQELEIHGDAGALRVAYHGERQVVEMLNWNNDGRTSPAWRTATTAACRIMVEKLVKAATRQLADEPAQYFVAQLLAAAPEELRNDDVALQVARRAVELAPDEKDANVTLGWALYRTGQWQACAALQPKLAQDFSGVSQSVLAMALWQLGQKDEARQLLNQAAKLRDNYEKKVADDVGHVWMPASSMVRRLHSEAEALLASGGHAETADGSQD